MKVDDRSPEKKNKSEITDTLKSRNSIMDCEAKRQGDNDTSSSLQEAKKLQVESETERQSDVGTEEGHTTVVSDGSTLLAFSTHIPEGHFDSQYDEDRTILGERPKSGGPPVGLLESYQRVLGMSSPSDGCLSSLSEMAPNFSEARFESSVQSFNSQLGYEFMVGTVKPLGNQLLLGSVEGQQKNKMSESDASQETGQLNNMLAVVVPPLSHHKARGN